MNILLTGAAGFIGSAVSRKLLGLGHNVVGLDNLNSYYSTDLKNKRLTWIKTLAQHDKGTFDFQCIDLCDKAALSALFQKYFFDKVVHLAAQPGVRYSLENPQAYIDSNVTGFLNVLEAVRAQTERSNSQQIPHLVYASSSSVYGLNEKLPFSEQDRTDSPASLYAATKKSNELMAHTYSHLFRFPTTGLRFFTVYGPWGRPDMALFSFTKNILEGRPIELFGMGRLKRDFTYIDDIVDGVIRVTTNNLPYHLATESVPTRIYNIGNNEQVELIHFVEAIEKATGIEAKKLLKPCQPGDINETFANISNLTSDYGYQPKTNYIDGITAFVEWYRSYFA